MGRLPKIFNSDSIHPEVCYCLAELVYSKTQDDLVTRQVYYEYTDRYFDSDNYEGFIFWLWKYHPDLIAEVIELLPKILIKEYLTESEFESLSYVDPWLLEHWKALDRCAVATLNGNLTNLISAVEDFKKTRSRGKR